MKKLKFLPTILMLVLCVGVLAIGIYAAGTTSNNITGTITINAANSAVEIEVLIDGVSQGDPVTVRSTWDFNVGNFTFDPSGVNSVLDIADHVITFKVQNKSSEPLGVYFHQTPESGDMYNQAEDNIAAGYAKIGNIQTEDVVYEEAGTPVLKANLTPYLYCAPDDSNANTYFDIAEMNIRFSMENFNEEEVKNKLFTYKLNIEPYVANVTADEVDASAPTYEEVDEGYLTETTTGTTINKKFVKVPTEKENGSDYTYLPLGVFKGSENINGVVVPSGIYSSADESSYGLAYLSQFENCLNLNWVSWCSDLPVLYDMDKNNGFGSAKAVYVNGTDTYNYGYFSGQELVEFSSSLTTAGSIGKGGDDGNLSYVCDNYQTLIIPEMATYPVFVVEDGEDDLTKITISDKLIIKPKAGVTSGSWTLPQQEVDGYTVSGWTACGSNGEVTKTITHTDKTTEAKYYVAKTKKVYTVGSESEPVVTKAMVGALGNVSEIVVGEGATTIDVGAFEYRAGLQEVILPSTLVEIKTAAFRECENLRKITFNNKSMDLKKIHSKAFVHCVNLGTTEDGFRYLEVNDNPYAILLEAKNASESVTIKSGVKMIAASAFVAQGKYQGDDYYGFHRNAKLYLPSTIEIIGEAIYADFYKKGSHVILDPDRYSLELVETADYITKESAFFEIHIAAGTTLTSIGGYGNYGLGHDVYLFWEEGGVPQMQDGAVTIERTGTIIDVYGDKMYHNYDISGEELKIGTYNSDTIFYIDVNNA